MSSREAERKALNRSGYTHWQVLVHPKTVAATLFAEGLITEAQLEDPGAQREALSTFITRHCKTARLLKDRKAQASVPRERKHPKAKRRDKPTHGPVRRWTPEDTERWESGESRPDAIFRAWGPSYSGWIAGDPESWPDDGAMPSHLEEFPPDWSDRGRSGDRDGRNRSRITGPGPSRKESKAKKIKQLTYAQLKRAERPYADKLKVEDSSPHFVKTSAKELRSVHGLDSTRNEGA